MFFTARYDRLSKYLDDSRWPRHELEERKEKQLQGMRKDLIEILDQKNTEQAQELETLKARYITFFDQIGASAKIAEDIVSMEIHAGQEIIESTRRSHDRR